MAALYFRHGKAETTRTLAYCARIILTAEPKKVVKSKKLYYGLECCAKLGLTVAKKGRLRKKPTATPAGHLVSYETETQKRLNFLVHLSLQLSESLPVNSWETT